MASIDEHITRISDAKSEIRSAIILSSSNKISIPETDLIDTYADKIRAIPNAVLSGLNLTEQGGVGSYIQSISQTNGVISVGTGGVFGGANVGLVPSFLETTGSDTKYLRADGTWATPPDTYYLYSVMSGATSEQDGTSGLVPLPTKDDINKVLMGSGSWTSLPVLSVTSTGTGNAITGISVSGHAITLTKGSTFSSSGHKHPTSSIISLDGYAIATAIGNLSTNDTLNQALGKLEYKANSAYNWILGVTSEDTDDIINKWDEIVGFVNNVKDTTNILDEFVTRKTDQTITGLKTFTNLVIIHGTAASKPLIVRGIVGSDGNGAVGPLHLLYDVNQPIYLGNAATHTISADGSLYSGTSAHVTVGKGLANDYRAIVVHNGNSLYSAGTDIGNPQYNYSTGDVKAYSFTTDGGYFNGKATSSTYAEYLYGRSMSSTDSKSEYYADANNAYLDQHLKYYKHVAATTTNGVVTAGANGFPAVNNANGILWMGIHSGNWGGLLGVSSDGNLYYRYVSNGNFTGATWQTLSFKANNYAYQVKGSFGDSYDWNDKKTIGTYKVQTAETDATNLPTYGTNLKADSYGIAMVLKGLVGDTENRTALLYIPHNVRGGVPLYIRMFNSTAWTAWSAIPSLTHLQDNYLPLTGGTLTGNLTLHKASGDSPRLVFQRGAITDGTYDWDLYVTGGVFKIRYNPGDTTDPNNPKEKWTDVLYMLPNTITTPWNIHSKGFVKAESSDSYVLLGGGGHKTISSLSVAYAKEAGVVTGSYTSNGGRQNPDYFGTNKVGFLMMNTTVNNNSHFKDWIIMDCYAGIDVGGAVAFGVNRQALGAYIMRSAATRTEWAESAELIGTHNYTSYLGYIGKTAVLSSSATQSLTGIGNITPGSSSTYNIGATDNRWKNIYATNIYATTAFYQDSDQRLKQNIQTITDSILDQIYNINEVSFIWEKSKKSAFGYIALKYQNISDSLVTSNEEGILSLNYTEVLVLQISALKKKIKDLEKRLNLLENF